MDKSIRIDSSISNYGKHSKFYLKHFNMFQAKNPSCLRYTKLGRRLQLTPSLFHHPFLSVFDVHNIMLYVCYFTPINIVYLIICDIRCCDFIQ